MNDEQIDIKAYTNIYFVGIGGIGMSALARYFNKSNWNVAGYDKTETNLTKELLKEGVSIHFDDHVEQIPTIFKDKTKTLVVFTPAVNDKNKELTYFKINGFHILKRSQVLGLLTKTSKGLCVAGTHGKTTTSTLLAHLLNESHLKCNAFLGGIASNFDSNLVMNNTSPYTVIEADEFDRSFLQLHPFASIITSIDADHLDIYGNQESFKKGFQEYASLIDSTGFLIIKSGIELKTNCKQITYGISTKTAICNADAKIENIRFEQGVFLFDFKYQTKTWKAVEFGQPGIHNAENALACILFCLELGLSEEEIRSGLKSFRGVKRRFDYHFKSQNLTYIDDYAHHPTEINALINSVKLLYPEQKIRAIFQPHLFSRTKDFMKDFCKELSCVDELLLMDIYPAREEPIPGINSQKLLAAIENSNAGIYNAEQILERVAKIKDGVLLTIGAGNIDLLVPKIKTILNKNTHICK